MNKVKKIIFVIALTGLMAQCTEAATILKGKVLGSDSAPLIDAGISVLSPLDHSDQTLVKTNSNGEYQITLQEKGLYYLKYKGVGVRNYHLNLLVEEDKTIELDMYLQPYRLKSAINKLKANIYETESKKLITSIDLIKSSKGWSGVASLSQTDVVYNIAGLSQIGHSMSNPLNEQSFIAVSRDGYVDSFSPAKTAEGKLKIDVERPKNQAKGTARFNLTNASLNQRIIAEQSFIMVKDVLDLFEIRNEKPETYESAIVKYEAWLQKQLLESESLKKQLLLIAGVFILPNSQIFAQQALADIPTDSPIWNIRSELFSKALYKSYGEQNFGNDTLSDVDIANKIAGEKKELVQKFLSESINKSSKKQLLSSLLYDLADEDVNGYFKDLYPVYLAMLTDKEKARAEKRIGYSRKIAVGNRLPNFQIADIAKDKGLISNQSIKGKYVLFDFWATWCSPCLKEMPFLHDAKEKLKTKNFEIVSISWDHTRADFDKFLKGKWAMPWTHVFDAENIDSQLSKDFEVYTIPRTILVDPYGKIIAANSQLKGAQLMRTLNRVIVD